MAARRSESGCIRPCGGNTAPPDALVRLRQSNDESITEDAAREDWNRRRVDKGNLSRRGSLRKITLSPDIRTEGSRLSTNQSTAELMGAFVARSNSNGIWNIRDGIKEPGLRSFDLTVKRDQLPAMHGIFNLCCGIELYVRQ